MSGPAGFTVVTAEEAAASVARKRAARAAKRDPRLRPGASAPSAAPARSAEAVPSAAPQEAAAAADDAPRKPPVVLGGSNEVDWQDDSARPGYADSDADDFVPPARGATLSPAPAAVEFGQVARTVTVVVPGVGVIELTPRSVSITKAIVGLLFDNSVPAPQFIPALGAHITVQADGISAECLYAGMLVKFGSVTVMAFHRKDAQ